MTAMDDAHPAPHPRTPVRGFLRGLLPSARPEPINPALIKHAEARAENVQNRIADKITAFSGSMAFVYLHIVVFAAWMLFV